ncbi:MAG: hypothetical protein HY862_06085 [Chloroflexi bacterium]|nr:hypothetical protein [Chloroflexota bacterium]
MIFSFHKRTFSHRLVILMLLTSLLVANQWSHVDASPHSQGPLTQYVQSSDGRVSLLLPDTWTYTDVAASENILTYGESVDAVTGRLNDARGQTGLIVGNGGTIILQNVADYGYTVASTDILKSLMDSVLLQLQNAGGTILEDAQEVEINSGQTIVLAIIATAGEHGYAAVLGSGDTIAIMTATGTPSTWEANRDLLYSIIQNVHIPAEEATTNNSPDEGATGGGTTVVRATDGSLSIAIPTGWSFKDEITDNQIFVFGETGAETENRSVFWISNEQVVVGGSGGLISSRSVEEVGLDLTTTDIESATDTFVGNLGVTVIEPKQALTVNNASGAYVVADWGQQRGYLAFIVFGDTLAIVYISDTPANFETSRNTLLTILESLRMPAEIAAPPTAGTGNPNNNATPSSGGTGLGGVLGSTGNQGTSDIPLPQSLRNEEGTLEVLLPEDWQTYVAPSDEAFVAGGDTIFFASNQVEIGVLRNSGSPTAAGGVIIFFDRILIDTTSSLTPEQILPLLDSPNLTGRSDTQTDTINGNEAIWYEFNQDVPNPTHGYWVVFVFEDKLALMALRTPPSDWEQSGPILEAIFKSVRYNPSGLTGLGSTGGLGGLGETTATPVPLRPGGSTPTPTQLPASPTPTTGSGQLQTTPGGPTPTPTLSSVG